MINYSDLLSNIYTRRKITHTGFQLKEVPPKDVDGAEDFDTQGHRFAPSCLWLHVW